jgi:hypothetical protein
MEIANARIGSPSLSEGLSETGSAKAS